MQERLRSYQAIIYRFYPNSAFPHLPKDIYKDKLILGLFHMEDLMKPDEFLLQTLHGEKIIGFEWKADKKSKATIALIHGLGEHSGRYQHVAEFYNQAGFNVAAVDLYGHGKSGGKRGALPKKDTYLKCIDSLLEYIQNNNLKSPIILRGHSLGGELVLWYALERKPEIKGVISTSPFLASYEPLPPLKLTLARVMNSLLPSLSMDNGIDVHLLSRDPKIVEKYTRDPLVHKLLSARLGWTMVEQGQWILQHAKEFSVPLLLMVGGDEKIVNLSKIEEFARQVPKVDLKVWQNLFHETHNEPEKEMVLGYELKWVKNLLKNDFA